MTVYMRRLITLLCLMGIIAVFGIIPGDHAFAKSAEMKMPVKITYYTDWDGPVEIEAAWCFAYNKKGDVVKIWPEGDVGLNISYVYKKGKKRKATISSKQWDESIVMYFDKKGRLSKVRDECYHYDKHGELSSITYSDGEPPVKYHTTYRKGKKIKQRKGSSDTIYFNNKGLKTKIGGSGDVITYKYKMNGKYVQKLYDNSKEGLILKVFKYGKRKAPASRYYKIINNDERTIIGWLFSGRGPLGELDGSMAP